MKEENKKPETGHTEDISIISKIFQKIKHFAFIIFNFPDADIRKLIIKGISKKCSKCAKTMGEKNIESAFADINKKDLEILNDIPEFYIAKFLEQNCEDNPGVKLQTFLKQIKSGIAKQDIGERYHRRQWKEEFAKQVYESALGVQINNYNKLFQIENQAAPFEILENIKELIEKNSEKIDKNIVSQILGRVLTGQILDNNSIFFTKKGIDDDFTEKHKAIFKELMEEREKLSEIIGTEKSKNKKKFFTGMVRLSLQMYNNNESVSDLLKMHDNIKENENELSNHQEPSISKELGLDQAYQAHDDSLLTNKEGENTTQPIDISQETSQQSDIPSNAPLESYRVPELMLEFIGTKSSEIKENEEREILKERESPWRKLGIIEANLSKQHLDNVMQFLNDADKKSLYLAMKFINHDSITDGEKDRFKKELCNYTKGDINNNQQGLSYIECLIEEIIIDRLSEQEKKEHYDNRAKQANKTNIYVPSLDQRSIIEEFHNAEFIDYDADMFFIDEQSTVKQLQLQLSVFKTIYNNPETVNGLLTQIQKYYPDQKQLSVKDIQGISEMFANLLSQYPSINTLRKVHELKMMDDFRRFAKEFYNQNIDSEYFREGGVLSESNLCKMEFQSTYDAKTEISKCYECAVQKFLDNYAKLKQESMIGGPEEKERFSTMESLLLSPGSFDESDKTSNLAQLIAVSENKIQQFMQDSNDFYWDSAEDMLSTIIREYDGLQIFNKEEERDAPPPHKHEERLTKGIITKAIEGTRYLQ